MLREQSVTRTQGQYLAKGEPTVVGEDLGFLSHLTSYMQFIMCMLFHIHPLLTVSGTDEDS